MSFKDQAGQRLKRTVLRLGVGRRGRADLSFFHPTEGTNPYWEQLTPEAWAAIVHTPAEDELSAGATAHALDIGAIEE